MTERPIDDRRRIGLVVDKGQVAAWQAEALRGIAEDFDVIVLNSTVQATRRRRFRHVFYYLLNMMALRTRRTEAVTVPRELHILETITFAAGEDRGWQSIPADVVERIETLGLCAIIKFGMGLLRIPQALSAPILSYHHGDPRRFRGRPAGFYEMESGTPVLGQIVQILSEKLDAGSVVAFAETRVHRESYRATMDEAYRCSPLLLAAAVRNAIAGSYLVLPPTGVNYRLPANATVLAFAARLVARKLKRLTYAALVEKKWQVAEAPISDPDPAALVSSFPAPSAWRIAERPRHYRFLADPFPHPAGGMLVEALRASDGQGEIVHLHGSSAVVLCSGPGHISYPAPVRLGTGWFLVPEVAEWSEPFMLDLSTNGPQRARRLDLGDAPRLIDPTILSNHDGHCYLFANTMANGPGVLRLWLATCLDATFVEHPRSPIRISPRGARMGGAIQETSDGLLRIGQDGSRAYGDGVVLFRINRLSPTEYEEVEIGACRFDGIRGPHTLNFAHGRCLFDFYLERLSLFAGTRRLQSLLVKRRAAAHTPPKRALVR